MKTLFKNFVIIMSISCLMVACSSGISKTSKYDFNSPESWSAFGKDLLEEVDKPVTHINQIELGFDTTGKLVHAFADCQNPDTKYASYLIRKSYQQMAGHFGWSLGGNTDLFIQDDDGTMIKDIRDMLVPLKELDFAILGKTYAKILAQNKNAKPFLVTVNFYKNIDERFFEIIWIENGKASDEKQYDFDGNEVGLE